MLQNRLRLLPQLLMPWQCVGCGSPGSCPQGTLKELQYLNPKFKGGKTQGVSEVWENEQSWGEEGEDCGPEACRKEQNEKEGRGLRASLSAVKPDHQGKGGLQPLNPIITCKFTKKTTASVSLENATATCSN